MTEHANTDLGTARSNKKDEFYTQWAEIEKEIVAYLEYDPDVFRDQIVFLPCDDPEWSNFTKFFALRFMEYGIKKLISTSYAPDSNPAGDDYQPSLFEVEDPKFDPTKTRTRGKKFILEREDINDDGVIDIDDLRWEYLDGDGDFRSDEVIALRDSSDIVITNPPFSLFREFINWLEVGAVQFSVIGNVNAVSYKEVFPLIMNDELWLGPSISSGDREFGVPESYPLNAAGYRVDDEGRKYIRVKGVRWFTNIEHGRRHEPMRLMTAEDNKRFSRRKAIRDLGYPTYDNYDAIEVGFTEAIPSDYDGVMGVPITFLDKYSPEQFEILGITDRGNEYGLKLREYGKDTPKAGDLNRRAAVRTPDGSLKSTYARLLIRRKGIS